MCFVYVLKYLQIICFLYKFHELLILDLLTDFSNIKVFWHKVRIYKKTISRPIFLPVNLKRMTFINALSAFNEINKRNTTVFDSLPYFNFVVINVKFKRNSGKKIQRKFYDEKVSFENENFSFSE